MKKRSKILLVFFLVALTIVSLELVAFSSDVASQKKTDRAIASYEKKIEAAETKSCNTQLDKSAKALSGSCARALKSLTAMYDKYSDDIKANPQVISLHKRQNDLQEVVKVLEHQAAVDKIAQEYRRKIEQAETKTCKEVDHYGGNADYLCAEDVAKLNKIKERIPAEMVTEPQLEELIARHEKLKEMPERIAKAIAAANQEFLDGASLDLDFRDAVHDIDYWEYLKAGKANKAAEITYLDAVNKQMPKYLQFAADCKGKYSELIQKKEQYQAQCELAENAEKYRDMFAVASYKLFLQTEVKEINDLIVRLDRDKSIEVPDYNHYVVDRKEYIDDVKARVGGSYIKMGLPEPSYADLETAVANLQAKIKSVASSTRWEDNKTVEVSDPIEKRAIQVVEKMGMKLVKVGRLDEPWSLIKNGLGIPLRKTTKGWVMIKNPKESFCRVQYTHFTRAYDGTGYEPASNVSIVTAFIPTSCN